MNTQTLLAQLAAIQQLMASLCTEPIPAHTREKLWLAMNDVADARAVITIQQQLEERRTGVVTVREIVAEAMD